MGHEPGSSVAVFDHYAAVSTRSADLKSFVGMGIYTGAQGYRKHNRRGGSIGVGVERVRMGEGEIILLSIWERSRLYLYSLTAAPPLLLEEKTAAVKVVNFEEWRTQR